MQELKYQFQLIQAIRDFFLKEKFLDVLTPPMVQNPGMETHIHPFQVVKAKSSERSNMYLHTSPEFHMKKLLSSDGLKDIFTISYCFRDEPESTIHRPQFIMLEWYRKNARYEKIMDDIEELIRFCQSYFSAHPLLKTRITSFERMTVQQLFFKFLDFDILDFLDADKLHKKISTDFPEVPLPFEKCSWEDYYFLLFLNKIEPKLVHYPYLLIYEFPAPLAALSTLSLKNNKVCERFEVYLSGIELCNCFNELTSLDEQKKRFTFQKQEKKNLYGYDLPWPSEFLKTLESGFPESSGVALGVERLLLSILDIENPFFP